MPRVARALADEQVYHIINRGNRRDDIFHDEFDFTKMLELLQSAKEKFDIKIYAYCLMSNHYHLVVYTKYAQSLSVCMQWLGTSYVRYYNKCYKISGHLWQGRYKSFIVQEDNYLLMLMKYVEANPKRAKMVKDASEYRYSSLKARLSDNRLALLDDAPIDIPKEWIDFVNEAQAKSDLDIIRNSISRQAPLGDEAWQYEVAKKHGLEGSLKPLGRPKKGEM
jgi:putative transposase